MAYAVGFYGNLSPYYNFGHSKFVPEISRQIFYQILTANPLYTDPDAFYREVIDELYPQVETEIFSYSKPYMQLNFPEDGGVTGYFGRNVTKKDLALIKEFALEQKIDLLNTRAFRRGATLVVTVGSIETHRTQLGIDFKGQIFDLVYGEFQTYLEESQAYLKKAYNYAANET